MSAATFVLNFPAGWERVEIMCAINDLPLIIKWILRWEEAGGLKPSWMFVYTNPSGYVTLSARKDMWQSSRCYSALAVDRANVDIAGETMDAVQRDLALYMDVPQ